MITCLRRRGTLAVGHRELISRRFRAPSALVVAFSTAALGAGAARLLTTTYLPVLLERIDDEPVVIALVMVVNAVAGFVVPLIVGPWSDRRTTAGLGRRLPFMIGGTVVGAGGLVAASIGNGSYVALALAAALVYTGLNALTTAHRALLAEDIPDARRPAVNSAQELAAVAGGAIAVVIAGALLTPAPAAAFALIAALLGASLIPTLGASRTIERAAAPRASNRGAAASLRGALRRTGAREVLIAQLLWVLAYAAIPTFFVLYAEHTLGLGLGAAGAALLAFGAMTALGEWLGGRTSSARVHRVLRAGVLLLGAGLLAASTMSTAATAALPLAAAALGAGLVTSLGFAYFARFVPAGEAGSYSGVFFAGRGVAAVVALPLAGVAAELAGSYRAILAIGGVALFALVPLARAERRLGRAAQSDLAPVRIAAVMPVFTSLRAAEVARATVRRVDELVLVDDGAPAETARTLQALATDDRVRVVRLGSNHGKGTALAAGVHVLLDHAEPPDAILLLDSDGQHDPQLIPEFVASLRGADVVIGHRSDRRAMPRLRRIGNRAASLLLLGAARTWIPDTQNGMRMLRTDTLRVLPLPDGGFEAESVHLRNVLSAGRRVASVEIPTIYEGEPSHFRPITDTVAVARALVGSPRPHIRPDPVPTPFAVPVLREWGSRLAVSMAAALAIAAALPALQPLDNQFFLAVNGLGDGPEWLYQALDPHTRNYIVLVVATLIASGAVLRRPRHVIGAGLAVLLAGYLAGGTLEVLKLFVDRARPEEVLGAEVLLSHDRTWAHLASFPSGHLMVTAAMASAAATAVPLLRRPLIAYVALIAFTRVLFGAHFPLDVVVGAALGYELGLFSTSLLVNARLLPQPRLAGATEPLGQPQPALETNQ